jgi:membrane-bound serine protease (ClpP class)
VLPVAIAVLLVVASALCGAAPGDAAGGVARADGAHVDVVAFDREVTSASATFVKGAIDTAEQDGATTLVITIDTPGGEVQAMDDIVEKELASTVPIVTYVYPPGGHAASAGAAIALAAPIAAMAPDTRIGASSPVDSSGQDLPSTLDTKIKNDLITLMSGEQTTFHRNPDTATQMVQSAAAFSATDAVANHTVDLAATSLPDLLQQIDGRTVTLANGTSATLHTSGLPQMPIKPTLINQAQDVLLDPNVLFLLFMVAAACIYLELSHPGAIVPGTIGGIALLLFLLAAGSLQPNWAGLALMLLAIVLLAIDVRAPTHGVLTVGALISLIVGALIFFDTGSSHPAPGYSAPTLNPVVLGVVVALMAGLSALVIRAVVRSQRWPVKTGREGLIGENARVIEALAPEGRVRVLGESWQARLSEPFARAGQRVEAGSEVRVVQVDRLTLVVEPIFALGDVGEGAMSWTP